MIQVAGSSCSVCGDTILTVKEGTWCARCESPICTDCAGQDPVCPTCETTWDDPAGHFVYSLRCPECLAEVDHQDYCRACGADTRWGNQAEFDAFRAGVDRFIQRSGSVATGLISAGVLLILAGLVVIPLVGTMLVFLLLGLLSLGINLIVKGLLRRRRAEKLKDFH